MERDAMKTTTIKSGSIKLPLEIARRLRGKDIEIIETNDGVLLRPTQGIIQSTRGFLKGKGSFSSSKFMSEKQKEKRFE